MTIRKNLANVDESSLAEDLDCILNARSKGFRVIEDQKATAWEYAPTEERDIYIQKKRIIIGAIQSLVKYKRLLFNPKYGFFGTLILPGHKLSQILNTFFLSLIVLSSMLLYLATPNLILLIFLALEVLFFTLCAITYYLKKLNSLIFSYFRYFTLIQISLVSAWLDYFKGSYSVKWEKADSKRIVQ